MRMAIRTRACIAVCIFMLAASPAVAQAVVRGDWISLGDVAPVTGAGADILLGPAPPPGGTLALDAAFIMSVAKKSGVAIVLPLDEPVLVTRPATGGAPSPPPAPVATRAPVARTAPAPLSFAAGDEQPAGWAIVLLRDVERGQRIAAEDLGWADPSSLRFTRAAPNEAGEVVGMEARRTLKAGAPLAIADIKAPTVIRKGDPVKLTYAAPGLRLTADGLAQADAAAGDSVRVLNNFSKRVIEAQAVAAGEARVMQR